MTDTPKRLVGPLLVASSATTYYTVPASTTTIIRNIHILNLNSGTAWTFTMSIGTLSTSTELFALSIPPQGIIDWSGFLVMTAAEIIQASASSAVNINLTISGIEVT